MQSASTYDYDVFIIGGGPSGSTAGAYLAQQGKRVLIAEKGPFPAYRIGESMLPNGNRLFRKAGSWDKVEAGGFIQKLGAEFETGDGRYRVHNVFRNGLQPDLPYSYQVERPRFDQLLLEHAADSGASVDQTADIRKAVALDQGGYRLEAADGRSWTAKWLIDASGRRCFLGRQWKLPQSPNPYPSRIAVYNHFEGVHRRPAPDDGNIIVTRRKGGWSWHIPINESTTSIGMVTLTEDFKRSGMSPEDWFRHCVSQSPVVQQRLENARTLTEYRTTVDYSYMYDSFVGDRYFLTGDAATFSDPIFSAGIYLGMESSLLAADMLLKAEATGRALTPREQTHYNNELGKSTQIMRELIDTYYNDSGFAVFMNPTNKFQLFAAVNTIVAGNTRPGFGVRWRYALFRLICRLNKNYRIVPAVLK
ncbi:NAD(P)/FAD-dependent oxidoreductase [Coraliomargarita parva]|uniref:NAD(P)/FAD-dependent oxidoreductase n=1 Tax=Coraliomargarita parva TaxID=3014050 RepID=UPI0022B3A13B|nr:NAD(P)/FAD-dependent oxidoreductase [Coraliomargarita parva]